MCEIELINFSSDSDGEKRVRKSLKKVANFCNATKIEYYDRDNEKYIIYKADGSFLEIKSGADQYDSWINFSVVVEEDE